MKKMHVKRGDIVKVISGKDKGKEGKILAINTKKGTALVEGINMITKHTKPSAANQNGGIIHQEGAVDLSNLMYVYKGKATRLGYAVKDDKKVRIAKSTGDVID